MATVTKDFKIKSGLVVEGTTGTINGQDILTKSNADQNFITSLVGGSSTDQATANTIVKRDTNASFSANVITADIVGDVTGTVSDISNHTTDNLTEGNANKYFTTSRAEDATFGIVGSGLEIDPGTNTFRVDELTIATRNYVDGLASNYDAAGSASSAQTAAENYAGNVAAQAYANATSYTDTAITNLNLGGSYDALGAADTAYSNAISYSSDYTDNAVAALVDSAPAMLDTLNELAAAIADNPNYASDVANLVAGKQDTLTAGEGIYIDNLNTITGRQQAGGGLKFVFDEAAIDRSTVDGWYDASGSAANAYSNAVSYADGLASNYDASGAAANAQVAAQGYTDNAINALDTDDVEEGINNLYHTDSRAKSSAADLLTGASLTNITITGTGAGLTITAENGVADSTTDDLTEGVNNLYFTDSRAISAVSGADITPNTVTIDTYRKEEATQQYVGSASTVNVHSLSGMYESAKYLVRVVGWDGGVKHSQISEILLTIDGNNNIAITEYGIVHTSTNPLATFSATVSGGIFSLTATTAVNGCEIVAAATMLSWVD